HPQSPTRASSAHRRPGTNGGLAAQVPQNRGVTNASKKSGHSDKVDSALGAHTTSLPPKVGS
ncbi:MAG: hypothetical protein ABIQ64_02855, partial [Candidatus Saccharimonadales bacterium]